MTIVGRFRALGQVVEIRAPRSLASLLADVLGDLNTSEDADRRVEIRRDLLGRWSRRIDGVTVPIEGCPAAGFYEAIGALDDLAAAQAASSVAVLHASCIDVGGTAIAFAGLSGAGKSTLAAALATAGHGFISDEVTAVDGDGHVAAYHRPVGLRSGGAAAIGIDIPAGPYDYTYPIRMSDHAQLSPGSRLGAVVFLSREDVAADTHPVDEAVALFRLANMTLGATGRERVMFRRLEHLVRTTPMFELRSQHVDDAISAVERLAERLAEGLHG